MLVFKFSHRWIWGRRSSGMWACSFWRRGYQPVSKRLALRHPVTELHNPEQMRSKVMKHHFSDCCPSILKIGYSSTSPIQLRKTIPAIIIQKILKTFISYNFPTIPLQIHIFLCTVIQFYTIVYCCKTRSLLTILLHYVIFPLLYSSLFSLMVDIYSRNMYLFCTRITLCLDCKFASFRFSLYCKI